jgi:hypothetical protein
MPTLEGVNKKHFQINTRSWRLLADLIFDNCGDLIRNDERQGWHENYGKMISAETARRIGDRLERLIEQGIVDRYEAILEIANTRSYFPSEILTKFIEFCKGSGGFDIW